MKTNMSSIIQDRVNQIMSSSKTTCILTDDVVDKLQSKFPHEYGRMKRKDLTRKVTPAVVTYRQQKIEAAAAGRSPQNAESPAKFNYANANMRKSYSSTKAISTKTVSSSSNNGDSSSSSSNSSNSNSVTSTSTPSSSSSLSGLPSLKRSRKKTKNSSHSNKRQRREEGSSSSSSSGGGGGGVQESGEESGKSYNVESTGRYADLGGIEKCMQDVRELIEYPLSHPEIYTHLGVDPPRGILLHGPPGCGKTSLANAIAGELGVKFLRISAPEIVSGMSGQSEQKVRDLFEEAMNSAPCLVFIDEIDAITPKRETASRGMERRIVAQLLTCLDSLTMENTNGQPVMVIGATNRPNSLDPALRRAGRFDREICMSVPDKNARARILKVLCTKLKLAGEVDIQLIAKSTPGYVGADLVALTKEAAVIAVNRIFRAMLEPENEEEELPPSSNMTSSPTNTSSPKTTNSTNSSEISSTVDDQSVTTEKVGLRVRAHSLDERARVSARLKDLGPLTADQLAPLAVTMGDFLKAVKKVQPSAKREGFATIPNVTWDDIGALKGVRDDLEFSILQPIRNPERFEEVGLQVPAGVLLYGPPGCGKTMLAKAIAHESGANFISVKGPELLDKYVGESEKAVRQVFHRAQMSSPCVIFFDELDALCPKRGGSGSGSGGVSERVVNQLLTQLDGMESRRNVFVIAATNRPDIIDQAMLRPGRLDKLLYVPLPCADDRRSILKTLARKSPLSNDVNLDTIASSPQCDGFSGADVAALLREATVQALKLSALGSSVVVTQEHFNIALNRITPSVSVRDQKRYLRLKDKLSHSTMSIGGNNLNNGNGFDGGGDTEKNNTVNSLP
jgi:ribosome biogenesis ATPase